MRLPAAVTALVSTLTVVVAAAETIDSVDLQVGPRDRVRGTLRPAEERESFLVPVLRGTKVVVTTRRSGSDGPLPGFDVVDDAAVLVATGEPTSSGARLRGFAFATTGDHHFRVAGDGTDGDYRLDLALTPQARWTAESTEDLAPAAETTFAFAAPQGATVVVELRPSKGSALYPLLLDVTGPDDEATALDNLSALPARHRVTFAVTDPGEHTLRFRNDGTEAGGWKITVRVRSSRARRTTVDLRDDALGGEFEGARPVFGRIAAADRDTTILVPDGLGLDGVKLTVPARSLALPTLITLTETESFFVSDDEYAAGTALSFSPSGTTFDASNPATMTIPFDTDSFDDPASELSIVVQDAETGTTEKVAATSVDEIAETATFPVGHFSAFQAVSPRPRPVRGRFVDLELTGRVTQGYGAVFTIARNGLRVDRGTPRDAGTGARTLARFTFGWALDDTGTPVLQAGADTRVVDAVARVDSDAGVLVESDAGQLQLERGRGPNALASAVLVGTDTASFHAVLRRTRGLPTRTNLSGDWHVQVLEVLAGRVPEQRIAVTVASAEFAIEVAKTGAVRSEPVPIRTSQQVFPETSWKHAVQWKPLKGATIRPDGENVVLVLPVGPQASLHEVQLAPTIRGDVLVGVVAATEGPSVNVTAAGLRVVVLVRKSKDAKLADLPPSLLFSSFGVQTEDDGLPPHGLRFAVTDGDLTFGAQGETTLTGFRSVVGHDAGGLTTQTNEDAGFAATARLTSDGRLTGGRVLGRALILPGRAALVFAGSAPGDHRFGVALPSKGPP
jgi:hypothetical protein